MSIRITNISQSTSNKGRRIVICYVKENNGIEDNYKLSSFEIARPEMEEAWAAINVAYQRVHPDYREDETWVDFSFSSVSIKYVKNLKGDIVIKEFRLSGVMAWDYMGFSTITTDKISPQQNEELTAAVCKLINEAELYVHGKRAQMQLFDDKTIQNATTVSEEV
nr:MAG TPA: hypothetical protein [Caudoviricetes sp.]